MSDDEGPYTEENGVITGPGLENNPMSIERRDVSGVECLLSVMNFAFYQGTVIGAVMEKRRTEN